MRSQVCAVSLAALLMGFALSAGPNEPVIEKTPVPEAYTGTLEGSEAVRNNLHELREKHRLEIDRLKNDPVLQGQARRQALKALRVQQKAERTVLLNKSENASVETPFKRMKAKDRARMLQQMESMRSDMENADREDIRQRMATLHALTPDERRNMMREYRAAGENADRAEMRERMQEMRDMSPAQRRELMQALRAQRQTIEAKELNQTGALSAPD
ncbi:MAG: hypothetical protein KJO88_05345, partial [Gammaproteobacteria bacterium]|nr:hypothetical protein [Gammaproteobacteria bacterium]